MRHQIKTLCFLTLIGTSTALQAQSYVAPPVESKAGYVPVISDAQMEQCVKVYNEMEWLEKKINLTIVNQYSQDSVNSYNAMIDQHRKMVNQFNGQCAGKQSRSACETARKLNIEQGLPHQDC